MLDSLDRLDRMERRLDRMFSRAEAPGSSDRRSTDVPPLLDFVPRITPRWERPVHLAPIAALIERAMREEVRALVSVPPQHGKTELLLHAIAWVLAQRPERRLAYASYAADVARSKSRLARDYARAAGIKIREDASALHEWRTTQGGGLLATGAGGPLTSHGVDGLMIVDDPHKNRVEAESKTIRDTVHGWLTSTVLPRVHPGASVIVVHTRWHEDDLIGRLSRESDDPYEIINLPAIDANGAALWESRRPLAWLERQRGRIGEYDWASLYCGTPRPRGAAVFRDVRTFDGQVPTGARIAIGIDLAYTARTHADYSVAVVLAEHGGTYYVLDVVREQAEAPAFAARLAQLRVRYPVRPRWYASGTEQGVAQLLGRIGLDVESLPARADKFVRSQPVAAAWNQGKVLVRSGAPWAPDFVSELAAFTGVRDRNDDQVDALAAAFDALHEDAPPDDVSIMPIRVGRYR